MKSSTNRALVAKKQSTFSAVMANSIKNLLQGYTKGIRITAILILLLMGVSNAWADSTVKGGHIYFDELNSGYTGAGDMQFWVGHGSYSNSYSMSRITNTKLWYCSAPNWGDATYFAFTSGANWGAAYQKYYDRIGSNPWKSATKENYALDSSSKLFVFRVASTANKAAVISDSPYGYQGTSYNSLNKTITIKAKVSTNGGSSYSEASTPAKLTGSSKVFTSTSSCAGTSGANATLNAGSSSTTFKAGYTANTTLTAVAATGYTFEGWYSGSTLISDQLSTTVNPTGDVTYYAYYQANQYTVNFGVHSSGHGSLTAKAGSTNINTGAKVNHGSSITFTATPNTGYRVQGWYSDANCTNSLNNSTDQTYTINSLTTNATVYVKYEEIPEAKFDVTIQPNNANYGTVSPSGLQQVGKSGINITATAETGYQFDEWTCTDGVSVEDASDPNTTASATKEGTVTANFSIKNYPINYNLNGGTNNISNPASYTVETETITLQDPTKEGFLFAGWYTSSTFSGTAVTSITKGSTGDKTYYAKWIDSRDCIFFYNNLGWSNVYVYFYNDAAGYNYWADGYGTGANKQQQFWNNKPYWEMEHGTMTQIKGTNIWYYYATYIETNKRSKVSFANVNQSCDKEANNTNSYFQNAKVVYRADLDYKKRLPMFVPHTTQSHYFSNTKSTYYNHGYWMNYPTNTGYTLKIYDKVGDDANEWKSIPFEYSEDMAMPLTLSVSGMEGGKTYGFKILRADNTWYGNNSTMTTGHSGDAGQTAWKFTTDTKNCGLTTTAAGTYVFTLKYGIDRNSNYNYLVGVEYPASVGDYRLAYDDDTHPFHPGHLLKKRDGKDTVSFFVHHNLNPVIMLQEVTAINATTGDITWNTISTTKNLNGISATGIYNFILEQNGDKVALLNTITEYDGDFYIRTDATAGGWGNFRQKSNKMTYTSYAENQDFGFNHYFVEWINAGTNVKFTIANNYSYCLSDSLNADDIVTTGNLPANANVRFGWNSKTNELSRAYISGSSNVAERYLVLTGDDKLTDMDNQNFNIDGLHQHEAIFQDMGNWIYQLDAKAGRGASIQLTARYNEKDQTFFNTSAVALAEEGNETTYPVRFIYDFKTNNLMAAWLLEEENQNDIAGGNDLNANMLLLRRHHNQAQQIQLSNTLRAVGTAYGVMTFEKDFVNDTKKSIYERALYWVSFPFDVRIRDVFGFGEYMDTWIMEYYDGEARAKNGAWVDSESYWTYITDLDYVLKAGVGYVLCLDLDKMGADSKVFEHTSEVSLYFPSATAIGDIDVNQAVSITVPGHQCEIIRPTPQGDRHIADSHWNVIGVPRFINLNIQLPEYNNINQEDVLYYYRYNAADNTYTVAESGGTTTFQTMQAYMVQYAGPINWWVMANWTPQQLAARRNADATPEKVNLRLEIAQDDVTADKTFIQLQEEGATADFDMNKDLTKIINAGTNIYTIVGEGNVLTAGNVMPMSECVVPVGVKVDAEGEYTFRMPDGTEGMVVELIDYELETKTNLLLFDYTVDLSAGTCNDRFALHIQPNKSGVTTGVENVGDKAKGIEKYLIDGKLMIRTAEGVIYDAQGHVVQ